MLKRQVFRHFARSETDFELCLVGAQTIQLHDSGQPAFHVPSAFASAVLGQATDLQRPFECCFAIITQKDVNRLLPLA